MIKKSILAATLVLLLVSLAAANPLPPGATISPDVYGAIPGVVISPLISGPFSTADFTGFYATEVTRGGGLCPTCVNFVYEFVSSTGDALAEASMTNFAGWTLDAGY